MGALFFFPKLVNKKKTQKQRSSFKIKTAAAYTETNTKPDCGMMIMNNYIAMKVKV